MLSTPRAVTWRRCRRAAWLLGCVLALGGCATRDVIHRSAGHDEYGRRPHEIRVWGAVLLDEGRGLLLCTEDAIVRGGWLLTIHAVDCGASSEVHTGGECPAAVISWASWRPSRLPLYRGRYRPATPAELTTCSTEFEVPSVRRIPVVDVAPSSGDPAVLRVGDVLRPDSAGSEPQIYLLDLPEGTLVGAGVADRSRVPVSFVSTPRRWQPAWLLAVPPALVLDVAVLGGALVLGLLGYPVPIG